MRKLYKVTFEFRNEYGDWKEDYLNNNGEGFTLLDAEYIAGRLKLSEVYPIRTVKIEKI